MLDFIHTLPLWSAKIGTMFLFALVLAVVWKVPRSFIFSGAPDMSRWRDLRLWATALILVQFLIYTIF